MNENDFIEFCNRCFDDVFDVLDHGAEKHGGYMSFAEIEDFDKTNIEHIIGHLERHADGDYLDEDTCRPNLINVISRCLMAMYRYEDETRGHFE